ncbi:MAG: hypothetical protein HKO62_00860 [Gammaproteobacteria bacterium]|nr:hypothetical protein [Gammaproteobacteria bacterium]NNL99266.1 hypothetical protein [Gammaproteobacteria bacterium]
MSKLDGLLPEEYQAIVAPAMKAAAELAAARGDPHLYNDLACMLTLRTLIRDLADLYQDQWGALGQHSPAEVMAAAPAAACIMVLKEYDLEPDSISHMVDAIDRAATQLAAAGIFGAERLAVQKAWDARLAGRGETADAWMRQAATQVAAAIDGWEARRDDATH